MMALAQYDLLQRFLSTINSEANLSCREGSPRYALEVMRTLLSRRRELLWISANRIAFQPKHTFLGDQRKLTFQVTLYYPNVVKAFYHLSCLTEAHIESGGYRI